MNHLLVADPLLVADLFCGAGGSSTGAEKAAKALGRKMILVCVNHWPVAIETHRKNHPTARHYLEDVSVAKPQRLVPEGYLDLLMASPECTHFSRARGGKPVNDQSRMNPWAIIRWLTDLDVRRLLVENVPEFTQWGPVDKDGHPMPGMKGIFFESWVKTIKNLGYKIDWRFLNAADYGDATTRRRFFLIARKDRKPVRWPEPTHFRQDADDARRWKAAREIIDWNNPGRSLLDDPKYLKRPLSVNTRRRIARGLEKYGGRFASLYIDLLGLEAERNGGAGTPEAFTIQDRNHGRGRGMDEPVATVTASNGGGGLCKVEPMARPFTFASRFDNIPHDAEDPIPSITNRRVINIVEPVAEPFIMANRSNNVPRSMEQPIHTITAENMGNLYQVKPTIEPFVLGQQSCSTARDTDQPIPTVSAAGAISLVDPQLIVFHGTSNTKKVDEPVPSLPTHQHIGLVEPQVVKYYGTKQDTNSVEVPLDTITTKSRFGLVEPTAEPFITPNFGEADGQSPRTHSIENPVPTVTKRGAGNLVQPVMVQVNHGDGDMECRIQSVESPIKTMTSHRNIGIAEPVLLDAAGGTVNPRRLVMVDGVPHVLDIRFRMLTNRELARAMGFDDAETEYEFVGNVAEVTKQIGNAVPVNLAAALVKAIFTEAK